MAFSLDDLSINTIIGPNTAFTGDIRIAGFVRIDGDLDGNLETSGKIIVGEKARVRGNITAKSAVVGGMVLGDIVAPERVQLFATSVVIGDIITRRVEMADRVLFHGKCVSLRDESGFDAARADWAAGKAIAARAAGT